MNVANFPIIPSFLTTFQPLVGEDRSRVDKYTNVNTLVIKSDCSTVVTSYPGLPSGIGDGDSRIHGTAVFSTTAVGPLLDWF